MLAHELTHVQQFTEKRIAKHISTEELEEEALFAEKKEEYDPDPFVKLEADGEFFTVRASMAKQMHSEIAHDIDEWVKSQKNMMNEKQYLSLLIAYQEWLKETY